MLADSVGSGKTFVALAVAARLQGRHPVACLVPTALVSQWERTAARLGVPVVVGSHQQTSRGTLPEGSAGLVIVDESHHFRSSLTKRYLHVAPWLVGRPVLLLSATPIVNRPDDLAAQLLLGIRDDALVAEGVRSLRRSLARASPPPALGRLIVEEISLAGPRPERIHRSSVPAPDEESDADRGLRDLGALRLSRHSPTAGLIRGVLHRALASSPAALAAALRRYRALLRHADDARRAGREFDRTALRALAGELDDQTVMWGLFPDSATATDLALDDLPVLDGMLGRHLRSTPAADPKLARLRDLLADRLPTLVFTGVRSTVRYLRERLGPPAVAWCTGERAGLGHLPVGREMVLGWFRDPPTGIAPLPICLIATDVAAEGLDLQRIGRVVHYDLPWTATRLEQREGRAVRLGSSRSHVDVVRFRPPAAIEAALRLDEILARKAALPGHLGLGGQGTSRWRWRSALADAAGCGPAVPGCAVVQGSDCSGVLAGYQLRESGQPHRDLANVVGWLDPAAGWTEDEEVVTARLMEALAVTARLDPAVESIRSAVRNLVDPVSARLAVASAGRWTAAEPGTAARRVVVRLVREVSLAARRRDVGSLAGLERALRFVAGGQTAGETMLVEHLADADRRSLLAWSAQSPDPTARPEAVEAHLIGLVIFER